MNPWSKNRSEHLTLTLCNKENQEQELGIRQNTGRTWCTNLRRVRGCSRTVREPRQKAWTLSSPPRAWERKRESFWMFVCGLVEESERDTPYKSSLADPTFLSIRGLSAITWRTVRRWIFYTANRLKLPLVKTTQHRRTVRGPLADCPPLTSGLSAVPNFRLSRIVPIFSIPTPIWDHCSYKNPKISNIAWKPSKDSYEQVSTRIQK